MIHIAIFKHAELKTMLENINNALIMSDIALRKAIQEYELGMKYLNAKHNPNYIESVRRINNQ